jgi:hypothetical protein
MLPPFWILDFQIPQTLENEPICFIDLSGRFPTSTNAIYWTFRTSGTSATILSNH